MLEFGRRVRAARKLHGITQEQLAEAVECHVATIGRLERGEDLPGLLLGCKIARALSTNLYYLVGLVDGPTPGTQLSPRELKLHLRYRSLSDRERAEWLAMAEAFDHTRRISTKAKG